MTTLHTSNSHIAARGGLAVGVGSRRGGAVNGMRKLPVAAP